MFRNLGNLKYSTEKKTELKISLNELKFGINFFDNQIHQNSN